jgi:hypothetical protein
MLSVWKYLDATGIERKGVFLGYYEYSGTDVGYKFHRINEETGLPVGFNNGGKLVDIVSGHKLKQAERVYSFPTEKCAKQS